MEELRIEVNPYTLNEPLTWYVNYISTRQLKIYVTSILTQRCKKKKVKGKTAINQ